MASKVKPKRKKVDDEVLDQEVGGAGKGFSPEEFISQNRNLVLVGIVIIALVVGALVGYKVLQKGKNTEAHTEMFQSVKYFEADSLNLALNGDGQFLGFYDIAEDYSGTDAGNMANYYIGIINHRQGNLEGSIEYLEKVSLGDNLMSMSTLMALAFVYEDLGNPEKAASLFEEAAYTPDENEATTPTMLLNAGRNYEAADNPQKALRLYQKIKENFPTSVESQNIDKYIGRVSE